MTTVAAGQFALAAETSTVPVLSRPAPRLGADDAVTALYLAHYRGLVRLAALLLDDAGAAEEVVQDAYVGCTGRGAASATRTPPWATCARRRQPGPVSAAAPAGGPRHAPAPLPDAPSARRGALDRLEHRRACSRPSRALPERQRECLVLRYYGDLSEAEIADAIGISPGAVKSHASRGMAALRSALEADRAC